MKRIIIGCILIILLVDFGISQEFHWAKNGICPSFSYGQGVDSDSKGNNVFAIMFSDSTEFEGVEYIVHTLPNQGATPRDFLVLKTDSLGNVLWTNHFGSLDYYLKDQVNDIIFDNNDDILICGEFEDNIEVYMNDVQLEPQEHNNFIMKLKANGELDWIRSTNAFPLRMTTDSENNIYVTGYFSYNAYYGNDTLHGGNMGTTTDMFIYKLNGDGDLIWSNHAGTPPGIPASNNRTEGLDVSVNSNFDVFVVGQFRSGHSPNLFVEFEEFTLEATEIFYTIGFIAKLSSDGSYERVDGGMDRINQIEVDNNDFMIVAGSFWHKLENDFVKVYSDDHLIWNTFVFKISPDYDSVWFQQAYSEGCSIWDMVLDNEYNINYCGSFSNDLFLSDTILSTNGAINCINKIGKDGNLKWAAKIPAKGGGVGTYSISCDPNNNIAYTGKFGGTGIFGDHIISTDNGGSTYFLSLMAPVGTKVPSPSFVLINNDICELLVWPNPSSGIVYCNVPEKSDVVVYNIIGSQVDFTINYKKDKTEIVLDEANPGIYFVITETDNLKSVGKIIVK